MNSSCSEQAEFQRNVFTFHIIYWTQQDHRTDLYQGSSKCRASAINETPTHIKLRSHYWAILSQAITQGDLGRDISWYKLYQFQAILGYHLNVINCDHIFS